MLLLPIISLLATPAFYSAAKRRGLHPGRTAMLPFVVLGILLIFAYFGEFRWSQFGARYSTSDLRDSVCRCCRNLHDVADRVNFSVVVIKQTNRLAQPLSCYCMQVAKTTLHCFDLALV